MLGLIEHSRNQIHSILAGGGELLKLVTLILFGNIVGAQALDHFQGVGHGFDRLCIHRLHLIDQGQDCLLYTSDAADEN